MENEVPAKGPAPDVEHPAGPWGAQSEDGQVLLSMPWEVFVLGISLLSITNLLLLFVTDDPAVRQVVVIMDSVLILVFAVDFLRRLHVAPDNRAYLKRGDGWLDAISIIPMLRIARLLRIARTVRVMRRMGGGRALTLFAKNRATSGLVSVFLVAIIVFEFGAMAMLWAEDGVEGANILTAVDALWYLVVTMSTVGYGELYPVTDMGRLVGTLIIVVGVGVFGTLTGFFAHAFLSPSRDQDG